MMLSALLLVQLLATASASMHILSPRQSSDGCGPVSDSFPSILLSGYCCSSEYKNKKTIDSMQNPLVAIISYAREFGNKNSIQIIVTHSTVLTINR